MAEIRLTRRVAVPEHELEFRASRSGGPGGQGVNTTASKIELRFDIDASRALSDEHKQRVKQRLANRITDEGVLIIRSSEHRSQHQNREAAVARFRSIVGEAIRPQKRRKSTRIPRSQKRRRLENKRQRSEKKRLRKPPEVP